MESQTARTLANRLEKHPTLKARFEEILAIAENTQGEVVSAEEAEQRAIEPVRSLGNELLPDGAKQRVTAAGNELKDKHPTVVGNGKKKSLGTRHLAR